MAASIPRRDTRRRGAAQDFRIRCRQAVAAQLRQGYNRNSMQLHETQVYTNWYDSLRDRRAKSIVDYRIQQLLAGHPGDARPVGRGISELRINYGPGFRIYYWQRGDILVALLAGGDKDSQRRDIQRAIELLPIVRNQLGV